MPHAIFEGLSLVDPLGRVILTTTVLCLLTAVAANLFVRRRYAALQQDLERNARMFVHPLLNRIVGDALDAAHQSGPVNTQAIIEERLQSELKLAFLAERFVRAATGLVIILGLLGTFYGLSLSIGRIVHLVAGDVGAGGDVAGSVTTGLTHALSGMAVAFSNSLLGILSAVILTLLNIFSNLPDARARVMLLLERCIDRLTATRDARGPEGSAGDEATGFRDAVAQLERVVARFEAGLTTFSRSSTEFHEFNAHLKDNIQRMSLSFGDFSETLKSQVGALKARDGR